MDEEIRNLLDKGIKSIQEKERHLSGEEAEAVASINIGLATVLSSHPTCLEDTQLAKASMAAFQGMLGSLINATEARVLSGVKVGSIFNGN